MRFAVHGFALKKALSERDRTVWVHYIRPDGRRKRTIRLGRTQGPCGSIERTNRRPLFPFRAERGTWKLQFDTSKRFRRGTTASDFAFYTIAVRIRKV